MNIKVWTLLGLGYLALAIAIPALADTQVKIEGNKVTVNQRNTGARNPAAVRTVEATPVVVQERDPRRIEGEIIKVDVGHGPNSQGQIVVRDLDARERRVDLKPGMVSQYKVGDYVQVYLTADMTEAQTIHTRRTADIEGEIVTVDYVNNLVVIRETGGTERRVLFRPGLISEHKIGDRVRLYVTADAPAAEPVHLIRVR